MSHQYQQAKFAFSVNQLKQLPSEALIEVAFVGRSNAGKSSALNVLSQQKNLARVSKTPGRTQLINYFALPTPHHYLVDLPGYGYADVPPAVQRHWQQLLGQYLGQREALRGVVLLMDARHPLKDLDVLLLDYCAARALPVHILLSKADKLSKSQQNQTLKTVKEALRERAEVTVQLFSSLKKTGISILIQQLNQWYGVEADDGV